MYNVDENTNIEDLKQTIKSFCEQRNWDQFHNPKDLAIGIITEAAELLEIFRFKSENEITGMLQNPDKREQIAEELVDIFYFVLRFSQKYEISLSEELRKKMKKNEMKYPLEKAKGSNKKYTEY